MYIVPVESIPMLPTGRPDLRGCKLLAEEALAQLNGCGIPIPPLPPPARQSAVQGVLR